MIFENQEAYRDYLTSHGLDAEIAAQVAAKAQYPLNCGPQKAEEGRQVSTPDKLPKKEIQPSCPRKEKPVEFDFRSAKVPTWVRNVIDAHLAIEDEDAKKAGALGFMARALVIASMPYKDQKNPDGTPKESFTRQNGNFRLRIVAGYVDGNEGGIPFGVYPRLLMSWVTTETVRTQSPILELGNSLSEFLRNVLDLRSNSGGSRGTATRISEQMRRLFGSLITAQYSGTNQQEHKNFILKNILIADSLQLDEKEITDGLESQTKKETALWTPQQGHEAGTWQSKVKLTDNFFEECITNPVPIDLRAFKALRGSPLAMDLYTWMTYRMSYVQSATKPITWESLMSQFGSGYGNMAANNPGALRQAVLDFKRNFLKALKVVQTVYPEANLKVEDNGLVLYPSPTHIPPSYKQKSLF